MATTSGTLAAGKASSGQGDNRNHGRYSLKAKLAAGTAALGCAAALAFGGLKIADRPTPQAQPVAAHTTVAQPQTQAGNGYLEFSPGDVSSSAIATMAVPSVARTQTLAGVGYLEFQPGEGPVVGASASNTAVGIGLREYLGGEGPVVSLPRSSPATQPAPQFGPRP